MDTKQALMKYFSGVLKERANGKPLSSTIDTSLLRFLSRKELIDVLQRKVHGQIPNEWNIAELENEELLSIIGDDMFILSHFVEHWCVEAKISTKPKNSKPDDDKSKPNDETKSS